jgi:hypothetical protein
MKAGDALSADWFIVFGFFKSIRKSCIWLSVNFCGFRILVVLCGFYGNARHKPCESNEADRYRVMAAPPLVHRKGHPSSRGQQRHQDHHGCCKS